jgi:hypothetical protein
MTFDDMSKISKLVHDFVYNAETYAKVIINELNVDDKKYHTRPQRPLRFIDVAFSYYSRANCHPLPLTTRRKTIKPAGVGGVAGGEKFIVQGILFKVRRSCVCVYVCVCVCRVYVVRVSCVWCVWCVWLM